MNNFSMQRQSLSTTSLNKLEHETMMKVLGDKKTLSLSELLVELLSNYNSKRERIYLDVFDKLAKQLN
jgi:hypothetical protein